MRANPAQTQNMLELHPATAASLKETLMADVARFRAGPDAPLPTVEIDPETEERLTGLGYVGKTSSDITGAGFEDSLIVGSDPKDRMASIRQIDLARRYYRGREWPLVVAAIRRAVTIDPGFIRSPRMLAKTLDPQGIIPEDASAWNSLLGDASEEALVEMFRGMSPQK